MPHNFFRAEEDHLVNLIKSLSGDLPWLNFADPAGHETDSFRLYCSYMYPDNTRRQAEMCIYERRHHALDVRIQDDRPTVIAYLTRKLASEEGARFATIFIFPLMLLVSHWNAQKYEGYGTGIFLSGARDPDLDRLTCLVLAHLPSVLTSIQQAFNSHHNLVSSPKTICGFVLILSRAAMLLECQGDQENAQLIYGELKDIFRDCRNDWSTFVDAQDLARSSTFLAEAFRSGTFSSTGPTHQGVHNGATLISRFNDSVLAIAHWRTSAAGQERLETPDSGLDDGDGSVASEGPPDSFGR
jgi:hypothetical protein